MRGVVSGGVGGVVGVGRGCRVGRRPGGGWGGGQVVATGTPEDVAANPASHTGRYLRPYLEAASVSAPAAAKAGRRKAQ